MSATNAIHPNTQNSKPQTHHEAFPKGESIPSLKIHNYVYLLHLNAKKMTSSFSLEFQPPKVQALMLRNQALL